MKARSPARRLPDAESIEDALRAAADATAAPDGDDAPEFFVHTLDGRTFRRPSARSGDGRG